MFQEYGSESPSPNTRRVYIAYLDSVHFFQPRQCRTAVYHEILLGYLDYAKQLGYTMAHIWACPPSEGDDYIFHCHPPEQKIPKPKRLQEWYKKMLDKGIIERIILDYKDILKQAMEDNISSAAELPYFEGDFWPNVLEESIKELDQEEEEKRKQAEAAEAVVSMVLLLAISLIVLVEVFIRIFWISFFLQLISLACCWCIIFEIRNWKTYSNMSFRYSSRQRRTSRALMVRRKARRRRRNQTSQRRPRERTARNKVISNREVISVQKYLQPWRNTRKCSSL